VPAVPVEIRPVRSRRELSQFIKVPFRVHAESKQWVAPLIFERKQFLDRKKNPFFEHAQAEYFLAWRDGRAVGRITAQRDENFVEFQGKDWGQFGFFEVEPDDAEAAIALVEAACAWLRSRGCVHVFGPANFSTNDECGVLVDGFDQDPIILTDWTHPNYPKLLEGAGLAKDMDLYMWQLYVDKREDVHPAIWQVAADVEAKHGVKVRHMRKRDLESEITKFMEVYNASWERNWGFVPLTDDEVRHYAKDLKPVLDENWAFIAQKGDETVGAALTLPDFNQVLHKLDGRLLPFGWAKALWHKRKIDRVRVFALGVKPEYQHTGVAARMYELHFDSAARTPQTGGEMGWILESNKGMNRAMEGMGGKIVRRYRFYEKELTVPAGRESPARL